MSRLKYAVAVGVVLWALFMQYSGLYAFTRVASDEEIAALKRRSAKHEVAKKPPVKYPDVYRNVVPKVQPRKTYAPAREPSKPKVYVNREPVKVVPKRQVNIRKVPRNFPAGLVSLEQNFARELTNTIARNVALDLRENDQAEPTDAMNYSIKLKDGVRIKYRGKFRYGKVQDLACEIEIPGLPDWKTWKGQWTGAGVTRNRLRIAISKLRKAGIRIGRIDIAITSVKEEKAAEKLLVDLGLEDRSILGWSPDGHRMVRVEIRDPLPKLKKVAHKI